MIIKLLWKLFIPVTVMVGFSYINNHLPIINRFIPYANLDYIYYISGIGLWLMLAHIASICVNTIIWDEFCRKRRNFEPPDVIETLVLISIYVIALIGIIGIVFDQSVTGIIAMTSVAGGIIGFALKDMIADFFTGIALNLDNGLKVGDWVALNDECGNRVIGWVQEITWRTTRIGKKDGTSIIFPNNVISNTPIRNLVINGAANRFKQTIYIDQNADPIRVIRVLTAAIHSVPGILENPRPKIVLDEITTQGIGYKMRYWLIPEKTSPGKIKNILMHSVIHHLKQADIALSNNSERYITSIPDPRYKDLDQTRDKIITKVPSLNTLTQTEKDSLSRAMIRHEIKEGTKVMKQGDAADSLFILTEGVLDILSFKSEQNAEVKIGQIYPGDFFGEKSLLTGESRNSTLVAACESIVYEITREHLEPIIHTRPNLIESLCRFIAEREVKTSKTFSTHSTSQQKIDQQKIENTLLLKMRSFFNMNPVTASTSDPSSPPEDRNPFSYH